MLRLVINSDPIMIISGGYRSKVENILSSITVNREDFLLQAPPGGIPVSNNGKYFPPGSLQIILDDAYRQVSNEYTTLPSPALVSDCPCSGWCRKQHIYVNRGWTEKAVIFFDRQGWPIACRENMLNGNDVVSRRWWRFDYSRPQYLGY